MSVHDAMRIMYGLLGSPGIDRSKFPFECVSSPLRMMAEYGLKRVLAYVVLRVGQGEESAPQSVGGY